MPRIKKRKIERTKDKGLLSYFKWGESYTSLILGIIIVVVVGILVISFIKNNRSGQTSSTHDENPTVEEEKDGTKTLSTYTIKPGDDLWSISEKNYKSGYNWIDIAKANHLENPGLIHAGNTLKIPDVKPITIKDNVKETVENPITQDKYTVKKGDNLWDIAVRAYGDGFRYVEIVKANNIENPSIIFADTNLKIPR